MKLESSQAHKDEKMMDSRSASGLEGYSGDKIHYLILSPKVELPSTLFFFLFLRTRPVPAYLPYKLKDVEPRIISLMFSNYLVLTKTL